MVLWLVLAILALFVTGHKLFGLNGPLAALLGILGGLTTALISFILATLIVPLVALLVGFVTAVIAAFTGIFAFLVGGIFTPLLAILTGWLGSIVAWLATTWLGTLLMPIYNLLAPIVLKIVPFITTSKYAVKVYNWSQKHLKRGQGLLWLLPIAASQKAARGRSSAPAKPRRAPARAKR